MNTLFINFLLISPWLVWNSCIFYVTSREDKSFLFIIISRRQLLSYWTYLLIFLILGIYIFFIRLSRVTVSLNIYKILGFLEELLKLFSGWEILGLVVFTLLLGIFWILLLRCLVQYFRKCLYSLYSYYYQYDDLRNLAYMHVDANVAFTMFLVRRVKIFTKNPIIIAHTLTLWPGCICDIERNIFRYILPYMLVFDVITQQGEIYHIFMLLPWYYIYSLLRSTNSLLGQFFSSMDLSFVEEVYGLKNFFKKSKKF